MNLDGAQICPSSIVFLHLFPQDLRDRILGQVRAERHIVRFLNPRSVAWARHYASKGPSLAICSKAMRPFRVWPRPFVFHSRDGRSSTRPD